MKKDNDKELHLVIIWQNGRNKEKEILKFISNNFQIVEQYEVNWNKIIQRSRNISKRLSKGVEYLLKKNNQQISIVLNLSVSLETVKKRISERKIIEKRKDDDEAVAIKRYETYEKNIKPVIDFYKKSNLLKVVNGEGSITEINSEISALIEGI